LDDGQQTDMADKSNRAAERDSVSNAKMKRAELTFPFQLDPIEKSAGDAGDALRSSPEHTGAYGEVVLAPGLGHEGQWKRGARLPFQNRSLCERPLCGQLRPFLSNFNPKRVSFAFQSANPLFCRGPD